MKIEEIDEEIKRLHDEIDMAKGQERENKIKEVRQLYKPWYSLQKFSKWGEPTPEQLKKD